MTYMDMTFCKDTKCMRHTCHRHPSHLVNNTEHIPVAMSNFSRCDSRLRMKGDEYANDTE